MAKATRVHSTPRRTAPKIQIKKRPELKRPAPADDPIFAAIENHRKLDEAWSALTAALSEAEGHAKEKLGRRPVSLVYWRGSKPFCGSEIDDVKAEFLKSPNANPQTINDEYWNYKARLLGTELARKEWDKRAGLATQRRDLERALSAEQCAALQLAKTRPTTPAGAGALLAYVKNIMLEIGDMDWHPTALDTIIGALATMALRRAA
jgi:hypothetical protein